MATDRLSVSLAALAVASTPTMAGADSRLFPPMNGTPSTEEVTRLAMGGGLNGSSTPGWQGTLALMGENRDDALLTQISLSLESVGTRSVGSTAIDGRVMQATLNPLSLYGGYGAFRLGAGFDMSWAFAPEGASGSQATGFGWGGRLGGGLSLHPGGFNIWILTHYRWMTQQRAEGWFVEILAGPD